MSERETAAKETVVPEPVKLRRDQRLAVLGLMRLVEEEMRRAVKHVEDHDDIFIPEEITIAKGHLAEIQMRIHGLPVPDGEE